MLYSKQHFWGSSISGRCTKHTIPCLSGQHTWLYMCALCCNQRAAGSTTAFLLPGQASSRFWQNKLANCQQLARTAGVPGSHGAAGVQASMATRAAAAVALDVEYVHMKLPDGVEQSAPAWMALVDEQCHVLLKTYTNPQVPGDACCFGGVPPAAWVTAPPLTAVVQQLQALAAGKLLIGHGLTKDLAALGMEHPEELMLDTMRHPAFCNKAGNSRSLKQLAKAFLDIQIQQQPRAQQRVGASKQQWGRAGRQQQQQGQQRVQHDPEEDAAAVMQLYQKVVVPSTYEGKVEAATQQLLLEIQQRQQQLQQQQREQNCDC